MPNCNFNCCRRSSYYPRQIMTCSCLNNCSVGSVVNPEIVNEFAVFILSGARSIEAESSVPAEVLDSSGTAISDGGNGGVNLTAGLYQVSYNVSAIIPAGGEVELEFRLDDVPVSGSRSVANAVSGQRVTLTNSIILRLNQNQVLGLVNASSEMIDVSSASISILKI